MQVVKPLTLESFIANKLHSIINGIKYGVQNYYQGPPLIYRTLGTHRGPVTNIFNDNLSFFI